MVAIPLIAFYSLYCGTQLPRLYRYWWYAVSALFLLILLLVPLVLQHSALIPLVSATLVASSWWLVVAIAWRRHRVPISPRILPWSAGLLSLTMMLSWGLISPPRDIGPGESVPDSALERAEWRQQRTAALDAARVDWRGDARESFQFQYHGSISSTREAFLRQGWMAASSRLSPDQLMRIAPEPDILRLPTAVYLHRGALPVLSLVRRLDDGRRYHLLMWSSTRTPVFYGLVLEERVVSHGVWLTWSGTRAEPIPGPGVWSLLREAQLQTNNAGQAGVMLSWSAE